MHRAVWVVVHRWVGLTLAAFLVVIGLTGSMLAFMPELNRWLAPELFPGPHGEIELDVATLAGRAENLIPRGRVMAVDLKNEGTAAIGMEARIEDAPLDFDVLYLDAVTGAELGRARQSGLPTRASEIMPFVYNLHTQLMAGDMGGWVVGFVALIWTLDCFVAFYLTLPARSHRPPRSFITRWRHAWRVKIPASSYRINFDLHRAGGLWLWAALLIFAWSGVYMDLNGFYTRATELVFDYEQPVWARPAPPPREEDNRPLLDWRAAYEIALQLMENQSREKRFSVGRPVAFYLFRDKVLYEYSVRSSRDVGDRSGRSTIDFDAHTGALDSVSLPTGQWAGTTLTTWLVELHMANLFGLPYKIFVSGLGAAIVTLSVTGVYIWWKKRSARKLHARTTAMRLLEKFQA